MLIKCYECQQEVSDRAKACPVCAAPLRETVADIYINRHNPKTPYNWRLRTFMGVLTIAIIVLVCVIFGL